MDAIALCIVRRIHTIVYFLAVCGILGSCMVLTQREKDRIIKKYHLRDGDTGSTEVQVALFTEEIKRLTAHLKTHAKDHSSRRGLLKMVAKRKRLLDYLQEQSVRRYNKLMRALKL